MTPRPSLIRACLALWGVLAMLASAPAPATARQTPRVPERVDSVLVVPGARYGAGGFRRFLLGDHYRDLWGTPIRVPYLDLKTFAGGLTPLRAHVGSQTRSLRFAGADGREYQFRSVFKTPASRLPERLQNTVIAELLQDGASASHPVGALVVSPLLEAAGVMHAKPYLAVMPDDPALGKLREGFAGLLGIIEERPDEAKEDGRGGYGRALKVIGPTRLFERVGESPADRVDARAFLTARAVDILIGDRDRHRDNWRWALLDDGGDTRVWEPISRDHDEAFVKLDGALLGLAKHYQPQLTSFAAEYDDPVNLNWHAREVDRRFLTGLERPVWDSVAASVQARLDDRVIEDAVRRLPPEMFALSGNELAHQLRTRRDALRLELDRYYRLLAREVDIHATDADEVAEILRDGPRFVDVTVRGAEEGSRPYYRRRFDATETREIRLGMWGGDDRVVVRGGGDAPIRLRVVGGQGLDRLVDSSRVGGVRFYDSGDHTVADLGRSSSLDRRPYPEWVGSDLDRYPPRDWGSSTEPVPFVAVDPDFGVLVGIGLVRTRYGFRKQPYASRLELRAGRVTGDGWGRVEFHGSFQREGSGTRFEISSVFSGIDILRYHGLGNDTPGGASSAPYRVELNQFRLDPAVVLPLGERTRVRLGPWLRVSNAHSEASDFFASVADTLYGAGRFGRAGLAAALDFDTRDSPTAPTRGVVLRVDGELTPGLWDARATYGDVKAEARTYLTAAASRLRPTLALRAGGELTLGDPPFQDAAYLGGRHSLRGWSRERFAGDGSLYGSVELRTFVAPFRLMLPADLGLFALADAGRVYVRGASPGGWHTGVGGGLWFAFIDRASTFTVSVARSRERTALYAGLDFVF